MSKPSQKNKSQSICEKAAKAAPKAKSTEPSKKPIQKAPLLEFPHFLRKVGPSQIRTVLQFLPSAAIWGVTSVLGVIYMSEWKTVLQYVPYYNGKYVEEVEAKNETEEQAQEEDEGGNA